jgi:hypothetical protein
MTVKKNLKKYTRHKERAILEAVMRENMWLTQGWRACWQGFDGRCLHDQVMSINKWALNALESDTYEDCTIGRDFYDSQVKKCSLD